MVKVLWIMPDFRLFRPKIFIGINVLKIFIWGGISSDIQSENLVLKRRASEAVKRDF